MALGRRQRGFLGGTPGMTGITQKRPHWKAQLTRTSFSAATVLATLYMDFFGPSTASSSAEGQVLDAPASEGQVNIINRPVAQGDARFFLNSGDHRGRGSSFCCKSPSAGTGPDSKTGTTLAEAAATTEISRESAYPGSRRGGAPATRQQAEAALADTGSPAGDGADSFDIFAGLGSDKAWPCACQCHKNYLKATYISYISGDCVDTPQAKIDYLESCGYPGGRPRMPFAKWKLQAALSGKPEPVGPDNVEESPVDLKAVLEAGYPEDTVVVVGDTYRIPLYCLELDPSGRPFVHSDLSKSQLKDLKVVGKVIVAEERDPGSRNWAGYGLTADDYRKRGIMGLLYALNRIDWQEPSRKGIGDNNKVTLNISWPEVIPSMAPEWDYFKSPSVSEGLRRIYPGLPDHFICNRRLRFVTIFERGKCACRYRHYKNYAKNPTLPLHQIVRPAAPNTPVSPAFPIFY